jgi:hypothetical protein
MFFICRFWRQWATPMRMQSILFACAFGAGQTLLTQLKLCNDLNCRIVLKHIAQHSLILDKVIDARPDGQNHTRPHQRLAQPEQPGF